MTDEQKPLEEMALAEMEARRDVIEGSIAVLRAKLENARAKRITTGEWADPDWYRRAVARLRFTGLEHQRLCRRIAEVKREARRAHNANVERAFVAAAKRRLDPAHFDSIMAQAVEAAGA
ncbi:MAG TPA: hypothetical protein VGE09_11405 [Pseudoxanthomonas sp.]